MFKLSVFLIICSVHLILAQDTIDDTPWCFQYRWVPPVFDNRIEKYNCTNRKGIPCIDPLINTEKPPDTTELWATRNGSILCPLKSGNGCIKYTFMYNNDIVNTSSFCGKVIEDQLTSVTSGCYQQNVDGHILETCVCQSRRGAKPCNASVNIKYSIILMITSLLFIFNSNY